MNDKQTILSEQHRYYYSEKDFPAWQQAIKHQASEHQLESGNLNKIMPSDVVAMESETAHLSSTYQPVNKFLLWLIMFISLIVLWIEQKWRSS